ncbi:MAG: fasciclin domain-containing protein [Chloroflexota bacterium]|nr:MAG: fasciclin domain-containing protein [Chloroflexota bacterium]
MKRLTRSITIAILALLVAVPLVGAAGHKTIVEIAVEDGRFDTLVAAVVAADLADALSGGEWTVFAPTDDAFAKLGLNENNIASAFSKAELTDILLYHALASEVNSDKALTLLGDVTMANGALAGLKAFEGELFVNDDSKVIIPDVSASNGVIHVVDTVILGPWPRGEEDTAVGGGGSEAASGNTIVDIAVNNGSFDTLVAAVVYAGLADALSGGEWTVFAPTDDAFAKLGLNANNITGAFSKAELADILLYHALSGEVNSDKALTLLGDVTMANGQLAGLKAFDGSLFVNDDSKVIIPDVNADNGVIHVVDTVILGPWPMTAE